MPRVKKELTREEQELFSEEKTEQKEETINDDLPF